MKISEDQILYSTTFPLLTLAYIHIDIDTEKC